MSWPTNARDAIALQKAMRDQLVLEPPPGFAPRLIGGADISLSRGSDVAYAGIVVIDRETMTTVDQATSSGRVAFPYVPGLLSFRELPALEPVWASLGTRPDVLVFDGQGYAHPRRFGLACHGGVIFGLPSVGCAKTILVGTHAPLGPERGARAPLVHQGEVVGTAIRLKANVAPVYVSPGHRMDVDTAVEVVLAVSAGYREPETTRRAHRLVNELRRGVA
ncbi:MAG TPA: endonuclease V [Gemmatimonadaceae bacterium]|nr:endonuclease V [Gemmatimonadaceae bacterium]